MFLGVTDMEMDAFGFWSSLIKSLAILTAIALVIYGPRRRRAEIPEEKGHEFTRAMSTAD